MSDLDLKAYSQPLSYMTYDFNLDNDLAIKPIVKSEIHFKKWITNYPLYANIHKEGVILYGAAKRRYRDTKRLVFILNPDSQYRV